MKKQPETTARTRQTLVDAFWYFYQDRSVEKIRVKDITEYVPCHRSTFYEYFSDVTEILSQEEDRIIQDLLDRTPAAQDPDLESILLQVAELYRENGEKLCLLTGPEGDPAFAHKLKAALLPRFRPEEMTADMALTFELGIHGLLSATRAWYLRREEILLEDYLRLVSALVSGGVPAARARSAGGPAHRQTRRH